jgi:hypothetical protein
MPPGQLLSVSVQGDICFPLLTLHYFPILPKQIAQGSWETFGVYVCQKSSGKGADVFCSTV